LGSLAFFAILATACSDSGPAGGATVSDSAGVRIVKTLQRPWEEGKGWVLSSEPALEIGVREGDESFQFFGVSGGARLSDGRIVILNNGTRSIRLFDSIGRFLKEVGGTGEGPGEFQTLSSIDVLPGDTLFIWDRRRRVYSLFSPLGGFLGSSRLTWGGREQLIEARPVPGGHIAAKTYAGPETRDYGVHRPTAPFLLFGRDGILLDTIAVLPGAESSVLARGSYAQTPFAKDFHWDVGDRFIAVGTAEEMLVSLLDPTGTVRAMFHEPSVDLTLSQEDSDWYRENMIAGAETTEDRAYVQGFIDALAFPRTKAAFSDLLYSAAGEVWIRTGRDMFYYAPSRDWTVISADGVFLGTLTMPENFKVLEVAADYVLGVWKDEVGVEFVRVYTLMKPNE
jgi:hypothetical protein